MKWIGIATLLLLASCSGFEDSEYQRIRKSNETGEYIYRQAGDTQFKIPPSYSKEVQKYAWDQNEPGQSPRLTKEYFRCRGNTTNPAHMDLDKKGEVVRHADCGGPGTHSLPLREGHEFIYPTLLELVNYVQTKTGHHLVITSGHRCPTHNAYVDPSPANQFSKHMIGAEVDFYVEGLQDKPTTIVQILMDYYKDARFQGKREYQFVRYEKDDTGVATRPWYNKEIFIKVYQKNEGRNFDNRHPYPYISVQVRYDVETQQKINYSWDLAFKNYMRW